MILENVKKKYQHILFEIEKIEIKESGLFCLKGKNGVGKTTLLNIIANEDKDYQGMVSENENISYYKKNNLLSSHLSFQETLGLINNVNNNTLAKLVDDLEVKDLINKKSKDLSIGEKQRLEIILCLSKESEIYLLDEPFSSLNKEYNKLIENFLIMLSKTRIVIVSEHAYKFRFLNGVIKIDKQQAKLLLVKENDKNDYHNYPNKDKIIRPKFFIFNKLLFLINGLSIISTFSLYFFTKSFQKNIYLNLDKQVSFSVVFVTKKYINTENYLDKFFLEKKLMNYKCNENVCYFYQIGNNETLNTLNKENPYLHFYSLESEINKGIKIKLDDKLKEIKYTLYAIVIVSFIIIVIGELLIYLLNENKHTILKKISSKYKISFIAYYLYLLFVTLFLSKKGAKIFYKFLSN